VEGGTATVLRADVTREDDLLSILDAEFLHQAVLRFQDMGQSFYEARQRNRL
jgi:hypothetical protein